MKKDTETRPSIDAIKTGAELKRWYWLKSELQSHAKACGLKTTGGKFQILERIGHYLDTGEKSQPEETTAKPTSRFDWHSAELTPETIITDSYKNSQNVRRFFKMHAGDDFKFNIRFMAWMRENTGKTLQDAVNVYLDHKAESRAPGFQTDIAHHNQFNQYTRDFLADNPDASMTDVRKYWALKRRLPSDNGRHVYEPTDLTLD